MQLTFQPARLTGFAILAVAAATALSVGACSSSHNAKSPETSSPTSANGQGSVYGVIASVSGNAVQVTETNGTATVDFSAKTAVLENTKAQLTDIAAGNCVSVVSTPASGPGGAATASSVVLTPPAGECAQPMNAQPGQVIGTVASVAGNTIHVTVTDANGNPSQTEVTVADTTQYTKQATVTAQAIEQGKCISAQGTKDGGGALQATVVTLAPATNGHCP
jgi:hypothetical protein